MAAAVARPPPAAAEDVGVPRPLEPASVLEDVVLSGVIALHLAGMMTLHLARVHIMRLHVTVAGQQSAVPLHPAVQTHAGVEHHLDRGPHLAQEARQGVPDLSVRLDVEQPPGVRVSQHASLLRADCGVSEKPEEWRFKISFQKD